MQHDYELNVIRSDEEFRELQPEWDRLYSQSEPRNPFLSFEWAAACREHVCPNAGLYILTARSGGQLVGIAPLRLERQRGFRVLRFIGSGWTEYVGFLQSPEHPHMERTLLEALQEGRGEWDLMVLMQLADTYTGLHTGALPDGLRHAGMDGAAAPYLHFDGDWDALVAKGPSWVKRTKKFARVWERDGGTVECYRGAEAAEHLHEVAAVEAESWKARYGDPVFQRPMVQGLVGQAFRTMDMELWIARMDGQPVAFHINFVTPERVWYYRGAYHEGYKKWSVGGVVNYLSMQSAWQSGLREYDFMSGEEPYKAERTNATRPMRYLAVYPTTARGYLAYAALIAPRWGVKTFALLRNTVEWVAQVKKCPKVLLPWSDVKISRVH